MLVVVEHGDSLFLFLIHRETNQKDEDDENQIVYPGAGKRATYLHFSFFPFDLKIQKLSLKEREKELTFSPLLAFSLLSLSLSRARLFSFLFFFQISNSNQPATMGPYSILLHE